MIYDAPHKRHPQMQSNEAKNSYLNDAIRHKSQCDQIKQIAFIRLERLWISPVSIVPHGGQMGSLQLMRGWAWSSLRTLQTFPRQISHANFVKIVTRMYYHTFHKSTFSSPLSFLFLCGKRLHCRYKFVLGCCCFVCCCFGGGRGRVLSWYFLKTN